MVHLDTTGRFPRSARILARRDFVRIQRRGVRLQRKDFVVLALARAEGPGARFGCSVSRKVGSAVVRNRLKRLMREVFRRCRSQLPAVDFVVILQPSAQSLARRDLQAMASSLLPALAQAAKQAGSSGRRKGRSQRQRALPHERK